MFGQRAEVTEIFSSIQGEGIFVGAQQIFVRFRRCNMSCVYCDEAKDLEPKLYTRFELMTEIKYLERAKGPHHSVSLTGGEPLLYAEFLKSFLKLLKRDGFKTYLETNGTLPEELAAIIDLVDIVAMDFKLPSSTGEGSFWNEHRDFLKIAAKKKVFVKAVVTPRTVKEDMKKALQLVKEIKENIPFILQPATPTSALPGTIDNAELLKFLDMAVKKRVENVRIIPQVHKMLNVK